jgi:hypothetical protein
MNSIEEVFGVPSKYYTYTTRADIRGEIMADILRD